MCWSTVPLGVFDSNRASKLVDQVLAAAELESRTCEVCGHLVPLSKVAPLPLEPMPHPDSPTVVNEPPAVIIPPAPDSVTLTVDGSPVTLVATAPVVETGEVKP